MTFVCVKWYISVDIGTFLFLLVKLSILGNVGIFVLRRTCEKLKSYGYLTIQADLQQFHIFVYVDDSDTFWSHAYHSSLISVAKPAKQPVSCKNTTGTTILGSSWITVLVPMRWIHLSWSAGVPVQHGAAGSGDVPAARIRMVMRVPVRIWVVVVPELVETTGRYWPPMGTIEFWKLQ